MKPLNHLSKNSTNKILITGSTGMLGVSLLSYLKGMGVHVVGHGFRSDAEYNFDLTNVKSTASMLNEIKPDIIVNLVALTDVDKCEEDLNLAYKLNIHPVENIVSWIEFQKDVHLIHISTDQVYDSQGSSKETDLTLKNIYALTKYTSEIVASKVNSTILRTNFFGKSANISRKSISDWIIESLKLNKEIKLFSDIYFSPLSIETLCKMLTIVIQRKVCGLFNLGSREGMSKFEFAKNLAKILKLSTESAQKSSSEEFNFKAYRPKDMRMDSSLFEEKFNVKLPTLNEEIDLIKRVK